MENHINYIVKGCRAVRRTWGAKVYSGYAYFMVKSDFNNLAVTSCRTGAVQIQNRKGALPL